MLCKICKKKEASEDGICLCYACSKKKVNHFRDDPIKGKFKIVTAEGLTVMRTNYLSRVTYYLAHFGKKKGHKLVK